MEPFTGPWHRATGGTWAVPGRGRGAPPSMPQIDRRCFTSTIYGPKRGVGVRSPKAPRASLAGHRDAHYSIPVACARQCIPQQRSAHSWRTILFFSSLLFSSYYSLWNIIHPVRDPMRSAARCRRRGGVRRAARLAACGGPGDRPPRGRESRDTHTGIVNSECAAPRPATPRPDTSPRRHAAAPLCTAPPPFWSATLTARGLGPRNPQRVASGRAEPSRIFLSLHNEK